MTLPYVRVLFLLAALYDGVLGVAFGAFGAEIYGRFGVPLPNHLAYVHFPALLLVVFGVMLLAVALRPVRNRNLILYGIGLKVAYSGTAFYYWLAGGGIPGMWKPFAVADLVFIGLFVWAYVAVGRAGRGTAATAGRVWLARPRAHALGRDTERRSAFTCRARFSERNERRGGSTAALGVHASAFNTDRGRSVRSGIARCEAASGMARRTFES